MPIVGAELSTSNSAIRSAFYFWAVLNWRLTTFLLPLPDGSLGDANPISKGFFRTGDFSRLFNGMFHTLKTSIASLLWQVLLAHAD